MQNAFNSETSLPTFVRRRDLHLPSLASSRAFDLSDELLCLHVSLLWSQSPWLPKYALPCGGTAFPVQVSPVGKQTVREQNKPIASKNINHQRCQLQRHLYSHHQSQAIVFHPAKLEGLFVLLYNLSKCSVRQGYYDVDLSFKHLENPTTLLLNIYQR